MIVEATPGQQRGDQEQLDDPAPGVIERQPGDGAAGGQRQHNDDGSRKHATHRTDHFTPFLAVELPVEKFDDGTKHLYGMLDKAENELGVADIGVES